jgi:hypothetical protein
MSDAQLTSPVPTSTLAIVSLVSGIATWVLIPILGAIIAVISGHLAKREIKQSGGQLSGYGLATAGLALGYLQLIIVFGATCIITILALFGAGLGEIFSNISKSI